MRDEDDYLGVYEAIFYVSIWWNEGFIVNIEYSIDLNKEVKRRCWFSKVLTLTRVTEYPALSLTRICDVNSKISHIVKSLFTIGND